MYIERDGKKHQVEGTFYVQGIHIVRELKKRSIQQVQYMNWKKNNKIFQ